MTTMTSIMLRAWSRPLVQNYNPGLQNIDHTWVTNIPLNITPDKVRAIKPLGAAPSIMEIAETIAPLNSPPSSQAKPPYHPSYTTGAIVYYGLDGVSHNVANQILCASGTARVEPLRVENAKGYALSTFFFSTYGLNEGRWARIVADNLDGIKLAGDDFLPIMNALVPKNKQAVLLDIRADMHAELRQLREHADKAHGYDYFPKLFKIALKYLSLAELRLGTPIFAGLFSKTASRDVSWLHPEGELSPAALKALSEMQTAA